MRMFKRTAIQGAMNSLSGSLTNLSTPSLTGALGEGYFCGGAGNGASPGTRIEVLNFSTHATAISPVALTVSRSDLAGVGSATAGYCGGGSPGSGYSAEIDGIRYADSASINPSAVLSPGKTQLAGASSLTNGYFVSGYSFSGTATYHKTIDSFDFASESVSSMGNKLVTGRRSLAATTSPVAGYFAGGTTVPSSNTAIESMVYSSGTMSIKSSTLSTARASLTGTNSDLAGYFSGGNGLSAIIDKITYATDTSGVLSAQLSVGRGSSGGASSSLRGYIAGGIGGPNSSAIDSMVFSTEANATISSTLAYVKYSLTGISHQVAPPPPGKGYITGGTAGTQTKIELLDFGVETITMSSAVLPGLGEAGQEGVQSNTKGFLVGGMMQSTSGITRITFSSNTVTPLAANLTSGGKYNTRAAASSATTGYVAGGSGNLTFTKSIVTLGLVTELTSELSAVLQAFTRFNSAVQSSMNSYFCGGDVTGGVQTTNVDKFTFANETIQAVANLVNTSSSGIGLSSTTKGYVCGGSKAGSDSSTITGLTFATDASATLSSSLTNSRRYSSQCQKTNVKGYITGGVYGSTWSASVEGFNYSTETSSALTATLSTTGNYSGNVSYNP